jgi:sugar phosphate isomerase/epimerase
MRICCGGRRTRPQEWPSHKAKLVPLLREAAAHAKEHGVALAIENHIDLLADELVDLIETVDSSSLGVCLDTANNLRMLEDPAVAIEKLAPFARATHVKDIAAKSGNPREFAFWPSVPVGQGLIDIPRAFDALRKHGYDGLLALEIDYLHPAYESDEQAIAQSIEYMRGLL